MTLEIQGTPEARPKPRQRLPWYRHKRPLRELLRTPFGHRVLETLARFTHSVVMAVGPERGIRLSSRLLRTTAPRVKRNAIAAENIALAFPELSPEEHKRILKGMWDNLGRMAGESAYFDWVTASDANGIPLRITGPELDWIATLRAEQKPGIFFSAHLANWELVPHMTAEFGISASILFRRPHNERFADALTRLRERPTHRLVNSQERGAIFDLASAFERGEGIGLMMDLHVDTGIELPFLGRPALCNPIVGRLARIFECPVRGLRVIRLPDSRFHVEVTEPLDLPRDAKGRIDPVGATAAINTVIEGWIREHPEQWFWVYERWRKPRRHGAKPSAKAAKAPA